MPYTGEKELRVSVLPFDAAVGKTLRAKSSSEMIAVVTPEAVLDENGQAVLRVSGELPGSAVITFTIAGIDATSSTTVKVAADYYDVVTPAPDASRISGTEVYKGTEITLTCDDEDAVIYYTTDGSCPCDEQTRKEYTAPITVDADMTLKAVAITEGKEVSIALEESGTYTMIIVTYDSEGNERSSSATTFEFSIDATRPTWQPLYTGTFTHNVEPAFITMSATDPSFVGNPLVGVQGFNTSYTTTIYQDANNPSSYKVEPWIVNGASLEFTMDAEGNITFLDANTGFALQSGEVLLGGDAVTAFHAANVEADGTTSWYDEENGQFVFGTVYYMDAPGQWAGGAYETFDITSAAGVSPVKNGWKVGKAIFPKTFAGKSTKWFGKNMGIKVPAAGIKGNLER